MVKYFKVGNKWVAPIPKEDLESGMVYDPETNSCKKSNYYEFTLPGKKKGILQKLLTTIEIRND